MAMKHPRRHHAKAAKNRRVKQKALREEKRVLRQRLAEAQKAQG